MSKRRHRKGTPNIPQEILERARQQIAQQEAASAETGESAEPSASGAATIAQPYRARPRHRKGVQPARLGERKLDPNDPEVVRQLLANPTKIVTEAELRQEYGYVLSDLKSMGLLAAGLVIALIVIAQIL